MAVQRTRGEGRLGHEPGRSRSVLASASVSSVDNDDGAGANAGARGSVLSDSTSQTRMFHTLGHLWLLELVPCLSDETVTYHCEFLRDPHCDILVDSASIPTRFHEICEVLTPTRAVSMSFLSSVESSAHRVVLGLRPPSSSPAAES